jgi:hypothetical protein
MKINKKMLMAAIVTASFSLMPGVSQADLIAQWDFDNNTLDSSGNGYDGADGTGALTYGTTSEGDTYAIFDGTSDYVATTLSFNDEKIDSLGIVVDFNTTFLSTDENDVFSAANWSFFDADRSEYFNLSLNNYGEVWFGYSMFNGQTFDHVVNDRFYNDGLWHKLAVSYGEQGGLSITVDGVIIYMSNYHGEIGKDGSVRYTFIGDGSEATEYDGIRNLNYYEGGLDSVALYDEELTERDLEVIFNTSNITSVNTPVSGAFIVGLLLCATRRKKVKA